MKKEFGDLMGMSIVGNILSRLQVKEADKANGEETEKATVLVPRAISHGRIDHQELAEYELKKGSKNIRRTVVDDIVIKLTTPYACALIAEEDEDLVVPSYCMICRDFDKEEIDLDYLIGYLNTAYTPPKIAQLMASICEIEDGMSVYDPCAGSGALLVQAVREHKTEVFAQERNSYIAAVMEMLLIMSGVREGTIRCEDSVWHPLTQKVKRKFDRIISEPPYMKPEYWYRTTTDGTLEGHILYYPKLRMEDQWVFVRHIAASIAPGGRAVVLLPMSMLTREGAVSLCREYLVQDGYMDSVIELPAHAFSNRGIKTSILVLRKEKPMHEIYILDLSRGLWEEKAGQNGIEELAEMVKKRKVISGISAVVTTEKIAENNYQLAAARYVPQEIKVEKFVTDPEKMYEDAEYLENKWNELCKAFWEAAEDYRAYCEKKKNR